MHQPFAEDAAAGLRNVLAWPEMTRSPQLARFLDYIVERTLSGDAQSIKAYAIAVDVFGRPADFDPQSDPIVRVQARRLRSLLDQYYQGPGAQDPVRILLPVGRYVPEFVSRGEPAPVVGSDAPGLDVPTSGGAVSGGGRSIQKGQMVVSLVLLALFVALVAGVAALVASGRWGGDDDGGRKGLMDRPKLVVADFQNLATGGSGVEPAAGLALELVTDLDAFETASVRYGTSTSPAVAVDADYVLSGIIRRNANRLQYSTILTEVASGDVVWNKLVVLESFETSRPDLIDHVSNILSRVLGSARGPLHANARALLASGRSIAGGETLYLCRMVFAAYRDRPVPASASQAWDCLVGLGERDADSGQALAMRASLLAEGLVPGVGLKIDTAQSLSRDAIVADPTSGFVWEQRARLLELLEQHDAAEGAYNSALQLNPADTDTLAARACHMALQGRMADAVRLSRLALDGADAPPAWYYLVPTLAALQRGDNAGAEANAEIYSGADGELGPVLAIVAADRLDDADIVNRYLPRVMEVQSFRAMGILTKLRKRIVDEALLGDIRSVLLRAGVPEAALTGPF